MLRTRFSAAPHPSAGVSCAAQWFTKAGFTDVKIKRIGPSWYRGVRRHGLIMGCSVTAVKPKVRAVHGRTLCPSVPA